MNAAYTDGLNEAAVYWPPGDPDGYGDLSDSDPVSGVRVRWEAVVRRYRDSNGETALSEATVYIDREVAIGGHLKLGTSTDRDGAMAIRAIGSVPSLDGGTRLHKAMLGAPAS